VPQSVAFLDEQISLRQEVFRMCHLRKYKQVTVARLLKISQPRVSQLLNSVLSDIRTRQRQLHSAADLVDEKVEELREAREEAWLAWERSKEDAESSGTEEELRKVYEDTFADGKKSREVAGESMQLVKRFKKIAGRLPANEYLTTVISSIKEEARLLGLTEEVSVKVYNTHVAGDQINVSASWDSMREARQAPDAIEGAIAMVANPTLPPPNANGQWTPAEVAAMDDDLPHLNGDGK
jgi:predicted transcriptional regulator